MNNSSNSSDSLLSNITSKHFNFRNNMIAIQTIDSKESQNIFKFDIFNKNNINKNYRPFYLQKLFKDNIIHKLYLIFLKMKYNYINLSNFINAIFKSIITFKKRTFLEYLSFYRNNKYYNYKKRKEFVNSIIRHINIYKKNNNIKNEVVQLIEKNLPENLNINKINLENKDILLNITSILEENLMNSQIFINNDNNIFTIIILSILWIDFNIFLVFLKSFILISIFLLLFIILLTSVLLTLLLSNIFLLYIFFFLFRSLLSFI